MEWITINSTKDIDQLSEQSKSQKVIIFKHSTRCPISSMALNRVEKFGNYGVDTYFLDLITYREVSNYIAQKFGVDHQSPQVLLIDNEMCIYDSSHMSIIPEELMSKINE